MAGSSADAEHVLRERILEGIYAPGDRIPSVAQIAKEFGLTQSTANLVVGRLRSEGLIVTRHGAGSFVRTPETLRHEFPGYLGEGEEGDLGELQVLGGDLAMTHSSAALREVPAPATVAAALDLDEGAPVIERFYTVSLDGRVVQAAVGFYDPALVVPTSVMFTDTSPAGVHDALAEAGRAPSAFVETLVSRMPYTGEMALFEIGDGTPVLDVVREAFDERQRCVEVLRMVLNSSAYVLDYSTPGIDPTRSAVRARQRVFTHDPIVEARDQDLSKLHPVQLAFPPDVERLPKVQRPTIRRSGADPKGARRRGRGR